MTIDLRPASNTNSNHKILISHHNSQITKQNSQISSHHSPLSGFSKTCRKVKPTLLNYCLSHILISSTLIMSLSLSRLQWQRQTNLHTDTRSLLHRIDHRGGHALSPQKATRSKDCSSYQSFGFRPQRKAREVLPLCR